MDYQRCNCLNLLRRNQRLKIFFFTQCFVPYAQRLRPVVKWAGGKEQELKYIIPNLPISFRNYYEPFVGGDAVYTNVSALNYYINDKSVELISLYKLIATGDHFFFEALEELMTIWESIAEITNSTSSYMITFYKKLSYKAST